jgi:methylmalonyl-CoA mutase
MDDKKKPLLFEDFPPVSTTDWEAKIIEDLKGADYDKRLVWKTIEGIPVKPYYRAEHLDDLPQSGTLPGEAPYARGNKIKGNDWIIRQDFEETDPVKANEHAREAIAKGAQAVGFNVESIDSAEDLGKLLSGIPLESTAIHLLHGTNYPKLLELLNDLAGSQKLNGSLGFDPLGYYLLYEKFHKSRDQSFERTAQLIKATKNNQPHFKVISINGQYYHNAGANIIQELAYSLSQACEYLDALTESGIPATDTLPRMQFTFAVGSSYFMEIAKLRATKMLWAKIAEAYLAEENPESVAQNPESLHMHIHAVTSSWNKSVYDPYVNMLRTTTEAMAAALGGVNSLCINAFDNSFRKPDAFAYRMARNQQIILKHEAYFNKVADPAAGSYYIENLTNDIATAAWKLFLKTEEAGGFIKAVDSAFIRNSIEETCHKRDFDIAMRKRVFVGTNQYANTSERMLDKVEPTAKLTDIAVLRQYRGTQAFEALRMAVESHAKKGFNIPKVFLFTYGNLTMRKARATFAGNFFGVAGYQVIDNLGFPDIETGVKAALDAHADIVVLCSSDDEYLEMAPAAGLIKKTSPKTQVVVAGNPKDIIDQLNQAGVDDYIHMRTNVLESLARYNHILDIKS